MRVLEEIPRRPVIMPPSAYKVIAVLLFECRRSRIDAWQLSRTTGLVRARNLKMPGLLALVAHAIRSSLRWTVPAEVAHFTACARKEDKKLSQWAEVKIETTHSCSTFGLECSLAPYVRTRRRNSMSGLVHRILHHFDSCYSHLDHLGCSYERCGRPFHTCNIPGWIHHPCHRCRCRCRRRRRRPIQSGIHEICDRSGHTGSRVALSEELDTRGSHVPGHRSYSTLGCLCSGNRGLDEKCRRLEEWSEIST